MPQLSTPKAPASQTLSRGIRMLELLADATGPRTIAQLAEDLGVHRSIAYRILRTLEDHRLVSRDETGLVQSAPGLAVLARSVQRDLQSAALPELTTLANELKMCAFVVLWDQDECTTLVTVEPRHVHAAVIQRPGTRHPFDHGAPGIAMQSSLSEAQWAGLKTGHPYRAEARAAAQLGYATSIDEVIAGLSSVAVPIEVPGQLPAAVAVVYSSGSAQLSNAAIGERIALAARAIEAELG
ncbi:ArsR family transcriptional regulator [Arthrobacter sp. MYb227]|uniref:IclR family transcriptional regulator n=1 Tax=Arthrobacter sp. MYb227 TaxID=1848601 RepID=UPI000CFC9BE6|nr:helix-turn-helix domain-containing protein [Arthrobacter sp. MYb227]PQZ92149.1 ArsR family transcriptional regulator [Arthrobacter sp. MYb227]